MTDQVITGEDQAKQPDPAVEQAAKEKAVIGRISMPTRITRGMWRIYFNGRQAAIDKDKDIDLPTARYYGVLALYRQGVVHIVDLPELENIMNLPVDDVPMPVLGMLLSVVADPIEQSFNQPFLPYLAM